MYWQSDVSDYGHPLIRLHSQIPLFRHRTVGRAKCPSICLYVYRTSKLHRPPSDSDREYLRTSILIGRHRSKPYVWDDTAPAAPQPAASFHHSRGSRTDFPFPSMKPPHKCHGYHAHLEYLVHRRLCRQCHYRDSPMQHGRQD